MGSWSAFLAAYVLGGLTFIPLVLLAILAHAHYTFPTRHDTDRPIERSQGDEDAIVQPGDDTSALEAATKPDTKRDTSAEQAAGYFAVCREYTPMGINAKPIERPTPVGSTTVAAPSPSVYQTMYRSLFDRNKGNVAAKGPNEGAGMSQRPKNAGNVFYVVLRHGHLLLFDDEEQFEVRHVISLSHHDVSIYSGGDKTPEGELWIKRNAIRLSRRVDQKETGPDVQVSKPFYLFSENCSAKEDFYFALLRTQGESGGAPTPVHFDVKNIISLVQKLHSTEDNLHTRWLNAMIGRVFLAIHQTKDLETFINEKITKKISRVKTPSFLTNINIQKIDTGDAAPYFTNFKLKDLTVEGECVAEADVRYTGNFKLEVAATAKLDLGTRMKAREVSLVLALTVKKIEGHILFKIKPPPSNRVWVSFEKMPKMEMAIEPIVSARQITYAVILRQIENRIKEVLAETLVQPFWDDIPFFKTEHKNWRGGIFEGDDAVVSDRPQEAVAQTGDVEKTAKTEENPDLLAETRPMEKSHSFPTIDNTTPERPQSTGTGLFGRKLGRPTTAVSPAASSTSIDTKPQASSAAPSPKTFKSVPEPVIGTDEAHAELFKPSTSPPDHATNYMAALHSRSQELPTTPGLSSSPGKPSSLTKTPSYSSASSGNQESEKDDHNEEEATPQPVGRRNTTSSSESASIRGQGSDGAEPSSPASSKAASFKDQAGSLGRSFFNRQASNLSSHSLANASDGSSSQKKNTLAAVSSAAAQARQWGWNAIQRQKEARKMSNASGEQQVDLSQPMGRGQPLPPPGTPLPRPTNGKTKIGPENFPKRKPLPGEKPEEEVLPVPNRRRRGHSHDDGAGEGESGEMLVVAAPMDESDLDTPGLDLTERVDYMGTSIPDTSSTAATHDSSQIPTHSSTPATEPATTQSSLQDYDLNQQTSSPTKISRSQSPAKSAQPPAVQSSQAPDAPLSRADSLSRKEDDPIVATPAAATNDEDDDYSGWMDEDTNYGVPSTEKDLPLGNGPEAVAVQEKVIADVPSEQTKNERDAALIQEASY